MKKELIKPQERYKHFKGGIIEVICLATDTDNLDRKLVIYSYVKNGNKKLHINNIWARSY
mgnify:CR=1 FL=1